MVTFDVNASYITLEFKSGKSTFEDANSTVKSALRDGDQRALVSGAACRAKRSTAGELWKVFRTKSALSFTR